MKLIKNNKGQSLIEYLVLVCLIAVGSMAVIRVVGKNVRVQFANISRALDGKSKLEAEEVSSEDYSKRDFSDFMKGSGSNNSNSATSQPKKPGGGIHQTMPDWP